MHGGRCSIERITELPKEWRYFPFPEKPEPLTLKKGVDLSILFSDLSLRQHDLSTDIAGVS